MKFNYKKTLAMKAIKAILAIIMCISHVLCYAQVSDEFCLGKIPVYKFKIDSLTYRDEVKRLSAIGTEYTADLYSIRVGENTYFKIKIDGETYAVVSNPYGKRVSFDDYYCAWLWKNGKYVSMPDFTRMAGVYFLELPYSKSDETKKIETSFGTKDNVTSYNSSTNATNKQIDWQLLGKVKVYNGIRTRRYSGEDDVVYDEEIAFLYSFFDGDTMNYKISIPKYGQQYDVYKNYSYNGAEVQWDRHGKRVWLLPSLSEMYTHSAGGYYFNIDDVIP